MRHGSLFSGIGGFDLAAQWMGWENVFHCEINPFCRKVLHYHWPNSIQYDDIIQTDFSVYRGTIDILTGGFPCQPFSLAGSRKGTNDSRYLWPEMLRAIREIRPRWIVGENVYGLVNWDAGMVFDTVCADLENEGFKVIPIILPAASVNAPHKRDRIWFVAYARNDGKISDAADADGIGLRVKSDRQGESEQFGKDIPPSGWSNFPTQSPICSGDDGFPPKLDGITFPKWRNESIKGFGNAIVPQVAMQIFKTIEAYESF